MVVGLLCSSRELCGGQRQPSPMGGLGGGEPITGCLWGTLALAPSISATALVLLQSADIPCLST